MKILQTTTFRRQVKRCAGFIPRGVPRKNSIFATSEDTPMLAAGFFKKLHPNQKKELDTAVERIADNPAVGEGKKGSLAGVLVYKFFMIGQLTLLAYTYDEGCGELLLLALGSHENFYRDLMVA